MKTKPIHLFINIIGSLVMECCGSGNFVFKQETLPSVDIRDKIETDSPWWFSGPVEKQQLCHLAKMEAQIPYLDYNITYDWHKHDEYGLIKVMRCATLPTMFVVKEDYKEVIQITFLESRVNDIIFDTQVIREFDFISRDVEASNESSIKPKRLAQLQAEDRKNMCDAARKFVNVVFLDNQVPEAQKYKFSNISNQEVHFSLVCPTSPKLCLYQANAENEVKLLVVRESINRYTFEVDEAEPVSVFPCKIRNMFINFYGNELSVFDPDDRVKLCTIARETASLPGTDTIVHEAEVLSFKFKDGKQIQDIAIHCPQSPELYLRLAVPLQYKIKIISPQNPFERYIYTVEFFNFIYPTKETDDSRKQIKGHWFSTLSGDDRWKLCYAVQKRIPHSLKLKTSPQLLVESPTVIELVRRYPLGGIREAYEDVAIRCSGLPEVFVRNVQHSKDVDTRVIQIAFHIYYFDIPRLRTLTDNYHEEQDEYDG